jgi:UDPglucose--hexose-1-phosphate uridylyltransferase
MTPCEVPQNGSHLRKDPVTQRWVVIHPGRAELPLPNWRVSPTELPADACPFCPGNEAEAGSEIYAEREPGSPRNGPGWWVRVLAARYPILHIEGELEKAAEGMYDSMNAIGAHEILIETPEHDRHWAHLEILQLERVLRACQQRSLDLRHDARFRYLIWVKNHGLPTRMFHHPHSHIVAAPFVPRVIEEELKGFADHMRWKERCVLCDMVRQEIGIGRRVILREGSMMVFVPFAPRFAHECWIVPVEHGHDFAAVRPSELRDLTRAIQGILARMLRLLNDPPYTLVLHSSPMGEFTREEYHWHLELVPHPFQVLGLEWGTGIYINPVLPEVAADRLRAVLE